MLRDDVQAALDATLARFQKTLESDASDQRVANQAKRILDANTDDDAWDEDKILGADWAKEWQRYSRLLSRHAGTGTTEKESDELEGLFQVLTDMIRLVLDSKTESRKAKHRKSLIESIVDYRELRGFPRKKKAGALMIYNSADDAKVAEAWSTGRYRTYAELDNERNVEAGETLKAIDRHRHRQRVSRKSRRK